MCTNRRVHFGVCTGLLCVAKSVCVSLMCVFMCVPVLWVFVYVSQCLCVCCMSVCVSRCFISPCVVYLCVCYVCVLRVSGCCISGYVCVICAPGECVCGSSAHCRPFPSSLPQFHILLLDLTPRVTLTFPPLLPQLLTRPSASCPLNTGPQGLKHRLWNQTDLGFSLGSALAS